MGQWIDEVARALASGIPRREALKRIGGGLAGAVGAVMLPGQVQAQAPCSPNNCVGGNRCCRLVGTETNVCCPPDRQCAGRPDPRTGQPTCSRCCAAGAGQSCCGGAIACPPNTTACGAGSCCGGTTPICVNPAGAGVCGACNPNGPAAPPQGNCPAGSVCATAGPNSGACVPCVSNAQCPPNAPLCQANNTCGGCTSNAQCAGTPNTPVCNTQTGACVACTGNFDGTAGGTDCPQTAPVCNQNGSCGPCTGNAQCPVNFADCNVGGGGACQPCSNPTHCNFRPATPVCSNGVCVPCSAPTPQACTAPGANGTTVCCAGTPGNVCNPATGQCVACLTDAQCGPAGSGVTCVGNVCTCAGGGTPCGTAPNLTCCPTGTGNTCNQAGQCVCGAGPNAVTCGPATQVANPPADVNNRCCGTGCCNANSRCVNGVCDCFTGDTCGGTPPLNPTCCSGSTPRCFNGTTCVQCTTDAHCAGNPGGAFCNQNSHTCQSGPFCTTSPSCPNNLPSCINQICSPCTVNAQCRAPQRTSDTAPVCSNGQCVPCPQNTPQDCGLDGSTICCPTGTCCGNNTSTPSCCFGATPFCNPATQTCQAAQGCTSNGDCNANSGTPICNPQTGQCVACTGNNGTSVTPANPFPCPTAANAVCDTQTGQCEPCGTCSATFNTFGQISLGNDPQKKGALAIVGGTAGTCPAGAPGTCPGHVDTQNNYPYDQWVFTNPNPCSQCVTVSVTRFCTNGDVLTVSAYQGSFNPVNQCQNYVASGNDVAGDDPNTAAVEPATQQLQFNVPGNGTFVIVVDTLTPTQGGTVGCGNANEQGYQLNVSCGQLVQGPANINRRRETSAPRAAVENTSPRRQP